MLKSLLGLSVLLLPLSPALAFEPKGEIQVGTCSAAFDDTSVQGPGIVVTRRQDGSWAGRIQGRVIDLNVTPEKITGTNTQIQVSREPGWLVMTGYFDWKGVRVYWPTNPALSDGTTMKATGAGIQMDPPLPQFLLALMTCGPQAPHQRLTGRPAATRVTGGPIR